MNIYIGSDHAGFQMKNNLISFLEQNNFSVVDCGPDEYEHDDDYPDYISVVADKISKEYSEGSSDNRGIVIGSSGQGEAMVANRFQNVRCAVFYGGPKHIITLSREHNDANVLSLGAHFLTSDEAHKSVLLWLHTAFSGEERHKRRIEKIEQY